MLSVYVLHLEKKNMSNLPFPLTRTTILGWHYKDEICFIGLGNAIILTLLMLKQEYSRRNGYIPWRTIIPYQHTLSLTTHVTWVLAFYEAGFKQAASSWWMIGSTNISLCLVKYIFFWKPFVGWEKRHQYLTTKLPTGNFGGRRRYYEQEKRDTPRELEKATSSA